MGFWRGGREGVVLGGGVVQYPNPLLLDSVCVRVCMLVVCVCEREGGDDEAAGVA